MRVRLYWSLARLAEAEGRGGFALRNIRKAIALLESTEDALNLARAHVLAARLLVERDRADEAEEHLDRADRLLGVQPASSDLVEIKILRSRIARIRGDAEAAIAFAREALAIESTPADQGYALAALADGLALSGDTDEANDAYRDGVRLLESEGRWRAAANAARAWGGFLRRPDASRTRSTCSIALPSSACARRRSTHTPTGELRARGHAARPVLARALGAALERRDTHVPRRSVHAGAPGRRPRRARARVAVARRHRDDPRRVRRGRRTPSLAARARRRPLRLPHPRPQRPAARPRVARAARAASGARVDGRAGASSRVLRPAHRGEARAPARTDDRPHAVRGGTGAAARRAHDRRPRRARTVAAARARPARAASAALVRLCRSLDLERLHDQPTRAIASASSASAGSAPGRSASSASRASAATTTASSATSA